MPGFAANRIQLAVLREALALVRDGVVSVEGADAVMKYGLGFRWACLGPLETVDFGGWMCSITSANTLCRIWKIPMPCRNCWRRSSRPGNTG